MNPLSLWERARVRGTSIFNCKLAMPREPRKERPSPPTPLPRGEGSKMTIPGPQITIDFAASTITVQGDIYAFAPLSTVAQELIINGGAEATVKQRLES